MTTLYLDNAATTPVRSEVLEAMLPYLTREYGNPSSSHTVGEAAASALADARARVAAVLGLRAGDVVFTSGGTEANNLAVKGMAIAAWLRSGSQQAGRRAHVITSAIEHESILESVDYLSRVHGIDITRLPVDALGLIDPAELATAVRPDTVLVTLGYANNEVGTVQDAAALSAAVARAVGAQPEGNADFVRSSAPRRRIPLHLDAVQAAGWLPLRADELGAEALSLAGHKLGAPKGVGVLAVRGRIPLEPLLHGGGQERGRRSGTENVAGAVGFATALEHAELERVDSAARVARLRDDFVAEVLASVPQARLTGHPVHRLPGTASFTFAGTSGEAVLLELERRGVVSSSGSACAAGRDEPSHVLVAMGIPAEVAQTAVRFTFSHRQRDSLHDVAAAVAASVAAVSAPARR